MLFLPNSYELFIIILKAEGQSLILSGDGRADSPGHCAKYGSYTVIDMTCSKVVDFKLGQVKIYGSVVLLLL